MPDEPAVCVADDATCPPPVAVADGICVVEPDDEAKDALTPVAFLQVDGSIALGCAFVNLTIAH